MSKFAKALRQADQDASVGKNGIVLAESQPVVPTSSPVPERLDTPEPPGSEPSRAPERSGVPEPSRMPESARVPESSRPNAPAGMIDDHLVSLISPAAFEAEQYRALRHIVEEMHKEAGVKLVAVSSPAVGDGKTTTAINLAGALAQSPEARVLLVDADVRRPSIGALLRHVEGRPGLVDAILNPTCSLEQAVVARPQFNLSFVHAGLSLSSRPYELLKSARIGELLEEAREGFDYVILDTPPLAAVQDCRLIARWVDGFLVVVAAGRTPRRLVEESLAVIEPGKIFGLVFNADADRQHISHYRHVSGYLGARAPVAPCVPPRGPKWAGRRPD